MKNKTITILIILLMLTLSYIAYKEAEDYRNQVESKAYQNGLQQGFIETALEIQRTSKIPVFVNETSIQWIDLNRILGGENED